MGKDILHIDLDAFFASVEQACNPRLRGRPVIVGGDPNGRGVVSAASYEARKYGIHSAMPMARAKRLCPDGVFLRGDFRKYSIASREIRRILMYYSPRIEAVSIDEAYLDLGGLRRLFGAPVDIADRIRKKIERELRLSASMGLSTNKLVSKVASDCAKPGGMVQVIAGYEGRFLAPLPIARLPGVGKKMEVRLNDLGIFTVGDLASLDRRLIERALGTCSLHLYDHARGEGSITFREDRAPSSISRETTFDTDSADRDHLEGTLIALTERACKALREADMSTRTVTVKLRYSDFKTVTGSVTLNLSTSTDHEIISAAFDALTRLWTRRARIRLIGVSLSNFSCLPCQMELFPHRDDKRHNNLYGAIDDIRDRFGFNAITRGKVLMTGGEDRTVRAVYRSDPERSQSTAKQRYAP
jgi:DNA polymerase-4